MAFTPVIAGHSLLAADYNRIQTVVATVIRDKYGFSGQLSSPVTTSMTSTAAQWNNLLTDINRCHVHQTGTELVAPLPINNATTITADWINSLAPQADWISANVYSADAAQMLKFNKNCTSTKVSQWTTTRMAHSVAATWYAATAAYFFNLGCKITVELAYSNSTNSAADIAWIALIAQANTALASLAYTRTTHAAQATAAPVSHTVASDGTNSIAVVWTKVSAAQIRTDVIFNQTSSQSVDLDITSTVNFVYAPASTNSGLLGIPAPLPSAGTVTDLETNVPLGVDTVATKILAVSPGPLTAFEIPSTGSSSPVTITLSNVGNTPVTVDAIVYSDSTDVTAVATYSWVDFPLLLGAGSSASFDLAYTGITQGTFNNSFEIQSNNDAGSIIVPTTQVTGPAVFSFELSPTSLNGSSASLTVASQQFILTPSGGPVDSYTATILPSPAFSLNTEPTIGPVVTFSPIGLTPGDYATTLTVTSGGINRTATINYTVADQGTTHNIGSWISAAAQNNAIVGASYDIIANIKYLTVGIGASADNNQQLSSASAAAVNVADLGSAADSKYSAGMVLYPIDASSTYTAFLNAYGSWVRSGSRPMSNVELSRTYQFVAPIAYTYSWTFALNTTGYFEIDGILVGDLRTPVSNNWASDHSGMVDLEAGDHTITFYIANTSNIGAIAIRIADPTTNAELWSTLQPQRPSMPYYNWTEVYRIPLTQSTATYQSRDYCIKDTAPAAGYSWGHYFGSAGTPSEQSLFTATDDGYGNLSISINGNSGTSGDATVDATLNNIPYAVYYYSTIGTRYSQLEAVQNGNQTHQFLGFSASGSAQTSLVTYPGYNSGGGGGSGCPDPATPVLIAPDETMPAGHLDIGDRVYSPHEHTGVWDYYTITHVEWINQPRLKIIMDDRTVVVISTTHKFLTGLDQWTYASQLTVGHDICSTNGVRTVTSITDVGYGAVIKLEVNDAHTYVAGGLISHNIKADPVINVATNLV